MVKVNVEVTPAATEGNGPRGDSVRVEQFPSGLCLAWHRGLLDFELGEEILALEIEKLPNAQSVTISADGPVMVTVGEKTSKLGKGKSQTVGDEPVVIKLPEEE